MFRRVKPSSSISRTKILDTGANPAKSKICSKVEHIFAEQKDRMDLFIRTIGIAQADDAGYGGESG